MSIKEDAKKRIDDIKHLLEKEKIATGILEEKTYNYEINATLNKNNFKILVYFGKKGLKTILQGNDKILEYQKIRRVVFDDAEFDFAISNIGEPEEYIGSDECGKGDFFGPLVVGAVFVNAASLKKLKALGVRDSKELNQNQIHTLSKEIKIIIGSNYEIVQINPAKYNSLYEEFKNLNKLLNWAHSKAIDKLLINTGCSTVITDQFSNKDLNVSSSINHNHVEFIQTHGGERFTGVAAASILARDSFNTWFEMQSNDGLELPKGSSELVETAARQLLKNINKDELRNFAKLHFKTTKKILAN
jgi:ribonuclease HIII